jgi:endonuclease-3 related protein
MTAMTRDHGDLPISRSKELGRYYSALHSRWGPQNWWPAQSRLEVIAGAYLTQNTNWSNVEKAIANLRRTRVLSVRGLREIPLRRLERLVRPSGYFRQKAQRLKIFIRYLDKHYQGSLDRMFARPTEQLRTELLALHGVGPETADSILLYAGNHPVFVVDAYTRRVLDRHGLITAKTTYEQIRALMEEAIAHADGKPLAAAKPGAEPRHPVSRMSRTSRSQVVQDYNELHALIVRAGNEYCRSAPKCEQCPLREFLEAAPRGSDVHW